MGYIVKATSRSGKLIRFAGSSGRPPVEDRNDAHIFAEQVDAARCAVAIRRVIPASCTVTVERI